MLLYRKLIFPFFHKFYLLIVFPENACPLMWTFLCILHSFWLYLLYWKSNRIDVLSIWSSRWCMVPQRRPYCWRVVTSGVGAAQSGVMTPHSSSLPWSVPAARPSRNTPVKTYNFGYKETNSTVRELCAWCGCPYTVITSFLKLC